MTSPAPDADAGRGTRRRVLVVDDHRTFAELLLRALQTEPDLECVGHVQSPAEARREVELRRPDLVVTDLRLTGNDDDGIVLTRELTAAHPGLLVVVLSAYTDGALVRRAAAAGAAGVVPKDGSFAEMLDVLRRVRAGNLVLHPQLLTSLLAPAEQEPAGYVPTLTPREQEVLELLAQGLDARAVARRLDISVNTCRGHVKSLLQKLNAHTQLEAVVAATRLGLISVGRG